MEGKLKESYIEGESVLSSLWREVAEGRDWRVRM